jgi:hypothetical protein
VRLAKFRSLSTGGRSESEKPVCVAGLWVKKFAGIAWDSPDRFAPPSDSAPATRRLEEPAASGSRLTGSVEPVDGGVGIDGFVDGVS